MSEDLNICRTTAATEDLLPQRDFVTSLNGELLLEMKTEVLSPVAVLKMEVLWITFEQSLRDMFLNGYESGEEQLQDASLQFTKYFLSHLLAARTLESTLTLYIDK